jgi:hypothetical protein
MTGAGLVVRDASGEPVASLTWVEGVGEGGLLLLRAGCEPCEVTLDLDALAHLANVARAAHDNARISAETAEDAA